MKEAAARDGNHFDETIDVFPLARLQNWSACYSSKLVQVPLRQSKLADLDLQLIVSLSSVHREATSFSMISNSTYEPLL